MGTEFFWFYDVILVAVLIGMMFLGVKRGFIRMVLSLAAFVAAFLISLFVSDIASEKLYESFVEEKLETAITDTVNDTLGDNIVTQLGKINMDKVTVGGKTLDQLDITPDGAGKITISLKDVDMSRTGLSGVDLSVFGYDKSENINISDLDIGTVQIYESDLRQNNIGDLLLAEVLTSKILDSDVFDAVADVADKVGEAVPILNINAETLAQADNNVIRDVIISVRNANGNPGKAILDNLVKPVILIPLRTLIFMILFVIILLVLNLVITATSVVNKLPLIGRFNAFLGGVLGIINGVLIIFIIVIILHIVTILTDNSMVFLNDMTIDDSYAFGWIYNFRFLDFLS